MHQDFRMQAYLAQYGNILSGSELKDDVVKKEEEKNDNSSQESSKRKIQIFTNWSDVKRALDDYELLPDDEMHEPNGVVYRFTEITHASEDNGEVSGKYEYEIVN